MHKLPLSLIRERVRINERKSPVPTDRREEIGIAVEQLRDEEYEQLRYEDERRDYFNPRW